ncbi:MAG: ABC transporter substrate-binding protein, partial [Acidimicrobiales bacterium]
PPETIEVDILGWQFPVIDAYVEELKDCEEGNYEFNVQFQGSTDAQAAALDDIATGNPSFEIYQGSNSALVKYANADGLLPLNDLIDKYSDQFALDEIDQTYWDLVTVDGNIYGVPVVSNTMHVFYNEPALEELGLTVPTTFDEAIAMCSDLQAAGKPGFVLMNQAGWAWQIEFDNVLGALGGPTNIDPETGQPNFTTDNAVKAATILKDMYDNCADPDGAEYGTTDIAADFQTGRYIVGQTWASRAIEMDDPNVSTELDNVKFAPALSTGGGALAAPAYIDGWGIAADTSTDTEALFLAIMAAGDRESQLAAAEFSSVTRAGVSNPDGPRNADAVAESYINGRGADLTHPAAGLARTALGDALIKISAEGADPATVLAEAEAEYLKEAGDQGLL